MTFTTVYRRCRELKVPVVGLPLSRQSFPYRYAVQISLCACRRLPFVLQATAGTEAHALRDETSQQRAAVLWESPVHSVTWWLTLAQTARVEMGSVSQASKTASAASAHLGWLVRTARSKRQQFATALLYKNFAVAAPVVQAAGMSRISAPRSVQLWHSRLLKTACAMIPTCESWKRCTECAMPPLAAPVTRVAARRAPTAVRVEALVWHRMSASATRHGVVSTAKLQSRSAGPSHWLQIVMYTHWRTLELQEITHSPSG